MKSRGNEMNVDAGEPRPDFVISDRHGQSADPRYTRWVADWFEARGYSVLVNEPYQGGDLVAHVGDPLDDVHGIQVEINRALYLDEATATRGPRFDRIRTLCGDFLRAFTAHVSGARP
jgi:N-formylglutamate deformylase